MEEPEAEPLVRALRAAGCVFAEDEAAVLLEATRQDGAGLQRMLARRVAGEPLEHVVGWADFAGERVLVGPGVFVPRRRTELLAREAVRLARAAGPGAVVVDLCCGAAALARVLARRAPDAVVHAADVDEGALQWARRNAAAAGLAPGRVHAGDLCAALPPELRARVSVLAVNAPYVPTAQVRRMPREASEHEPRVALDGGADGLDLHRRVVLEAAGWLAPGGHLVLETSDRQAARSAALAAGAGLDPRVVADEEVGGTVVVAERPRSASRAALR